MQRVIIFGVCGIVFLAAGIFYFFQTGPVPASDRAGIESLFSRYEAREAYEVFKKANESGEITATHDIAHIFGEVLYEQTGIEGFSICDASFGFGCFHSFIGRAVADHGESIVKDLDEACVEAYSKEGLGCSHGIGHGLLSYYGYDLDALNESLDLCKDLSWQRPLGGCQDGVFMEYNFRVMEKELKDRNRPFVRSERHEPCTSVGDRFKEACYFGLPAWWSGGLQSDTNPLVTMATFCAEVGNEKLRRSCYRGIGHAIAPKGSFDVTKGNARCDQAGKGRLWCREGLAWALYADPNFRDQALVACTEGLTQQESSECEEEYLFVLK